MQSNPELFTKELILAVVAILFILWAATAFLYLRSRKKARRKILKLMGRTAIKSQKTAKALLDCEEMCNRLVSQMGVGVVMTDADHQIVFANRCAADLLHLKPEDLIGSKFSDYALGSSEEGSIKSRLQKRRAGKHVREELQLVRGDDEVFWAGIYFSFPDNIQLIHDGALIALIDISDHITLEQKMHKYTSYLVQKVRQLDCMFAMQELTTDTDLPAERFFEKALKIIPEGLRHGRDMRVEIEFMGQKYSSSGFHETDWKHKVPIRIGRTNKGQLVVSYVGKIHTNERSKPFKLGEKALLKNLADKLAHAPVVMKLAGKV